MPRRSEPEAHASLPFLVIELDHNATTKPTPSAVAAMVDALEHRWHNPSSVHRAGQAARAQVELARADLAKLLHVSPRQLVFTSCGTESINLAIRGWLAATSPGTKPILLTSRVEHAAVRDLAEDLAREATQSLGGCEVRWLAIDSNGIVDTAALERGVAAVAPRPCMVAAQWANNETGAIQPVAAIAAACKAHRATFLCDATQWVGKMAIDAEPACDLLVCSPHKFHGPKGVGILWSSPKARWRPRQLGTQELGRRGGTENVPGIVGAAAAARDAMQWLADGLANSTTREQLASWRDHFERDIIARVNAILPAHWPRAVVNAVDAPRLWNTTNIAFPRLEAEAILLALSERGVNASAGAACSSGSLDPSPVLLAMGIDPELAHGSVRFSMSRDTTQQELAHAADIVVEVVVRLVASMP